MAHPKRKTSKTRRDKRRTHDALAMPALHLPHQAVWKDGELYYQGVLVKPKKKPSKA